MKNPRGATVKTKPRRPRGANVFAKAVAWIVLAIFVVTSVGIILIVR